jgi:hypothetical protein
VKLKCARLTKVCKSPEIDLRIGEDPLRRSLVPSTHHRVSNVSAQSRYEERSFFLVQECCCLGPVCDPELRDDAGSDGDCSFYYENPFRRRMMSAYIPHLFVHGICVPAPTAIARDAIHFSDCVCKQLKTVNIYRSA